jgi:rubrerythrin
MFEFGIKKKPDMRHIEIFREITEFDLRYACKNCGYEFDNKERACPKCGFSAAGKEYV